MTQKIVTNDEAVTWSKNFFFTILGTFGRYRYVTNLRGTLVENVKKVQNQPTLKWQFLCAGGLLSLVPSVQLSSPARTWALLHSVLLKWQFMCTVQVGSYPWYLLFSSAAQLGHELFFILFFVYMIWNVDGTIGRNGWKNHLKKKKNTAFSQLKLWMKA
jgi:hypothetical protein